MGFPFAPWGVGFFIVVVAAACAGLYPSGARAQARDFAQYTPRTEPLRIAPSEAPVIDGSLKDEVWSRAPVIDAFYQVEPRNGAPPSMETRVRIAHDGRTLYIAVHALDPEPSAILRKLVERDAPLMDEDAVRIIIDPFGTFRDAYFFGTNANGAYVDALVENGRIFRGQWNAIWRVAAKVVDDGWIAEFAIPFQSIAFDPNRSEWNFQIVRTIRGAREEVRWSNIDQTRGRLDLANPGRLDGMTGLQTGIGLDAQVFATGAQSYDWESGATDFRFDPSANIFYKVTPGLTASLTLNTDFSDAPLDARQVNTGRFSLFFPETRDFFLQDAAAFEFGGDNFSNGTNGLPFFSRRIGIVDGRPTDILAGAKLSGRAGPGSIGLIAARTAGNDTTDGQFLAAARLAVPVLAESKIGVIATYGDPQGRARNAVVGLDAQYRNSTRWPGVLSADLAWLHSVDDPVTEGPSGVAEAVADDLFTFNTSYRSNRWNWTVRARDIGADYRPRLGFANRTGIRRYQADAWRTIRPAAGPIRAIDIGMFGEVVTDEGDRKLDRFWGGWVSVQTNAGDRAYARSDAGFEDIQEPFLIAGVLPVAAGEYRTVQHRVELSMTEGRPVALGVEAQWGEAFDGDFRQVEFSLSLRPHPRFTLAGSYETTRFDLASGELEIGVAAFTTTVAFAPLLVLKTAMQYDNISENFTMLSRLNWEPRPGSQVFVTFGHAGLIERDRFPGSFRAQGSSLALRLGHTFRL